MSKQCDYISCIIILFTNSEWPHDYSKEKKEFPPVIDMLFLCY